MLADYVQQKGIALTAIAEGTGLKYNAVYSTLGSRRRNVKGDELLMICEFIEADPKRFTPKRKEATQ
jgi:lambda repressor-like predicted transcriptional regulator